MNRTEIEDKNHQTFKQEIFFKKKKKIVMNLMDQNFRAKKTARIRDELSDGSKLVQENMKEFMAKSLIDQKLRKDDDVTDQNVSQSRTTDNDPE